MILGRPTNLWLGMATAIVSGLTFVLLTAGIDPATVASAGAAVTGILGAAILLVAGQPPTLRPGDAYTVQTPSGEDNVSKVANTNVTPIPPNAGVAAPPKT